MRRTSWILVTFAFAAFAVMLWAPRRASRFESGAVVAATTGQIRAAAPNPEPVTATRPLPSEGSREPGHGEAAQPGAESRQLLRHDLIRSDPQLLEHARQQELAEAADARWDQAVNQAGYTAADVDPAVRTLFTSMRLEPRYAEGGEIDGFVIAELKGGNPLARAGFRAGDRLTRIQGVELRDPGEIAALIARLGPNISICRERDGAESCSDVSLE